MKSERGAYLLLHGLVLMSSLVPLLLHYISMEMPELVFFRMTIAAGALWLYLFFRNKIPKVKPKLALVYLISGSLLALTFIGIILAVKWSNATVTLVGISTTPLMVSILHSLLARRRMEYTQIIISLNGLFGIFMIFQSGFHYALGFWIALATAFISGLLTVVNAQLTKRQSGSVVTAYQALGAAGMMALFLLFSGVWNDGFIPKASSTEWLAIAVLAIGYSLISYLLLLRVLRTISPFQVSLCYNLTPIYGSLLEFVIKGSVLNLYFYAGAVIILFAVFAVPLSKVWFTEDENSDQVIST